MPNASINRSTFVPLLPTADTIGPSLTQAQTQTQASFHGFNPRETVQSQAEQTTELKVRIAVLETELRHVTRERDGVLGREGLVAGVLGRVLAASSCSSNELWSSPVNSSKAGGGDEKIGIRSGDIDVGGAIGRQACGEIEELKWELGKARRENLVLWGRIEGRGRDGSGATSGEEGSRELRVERGNSFDSLIGDESGHSADDILPSLPQKNKTALAAVAREDVCSIAPSYDSRPLRLSGFSGFGDSGGNDEIFNEGNPGLGLDIATAGDSNAQKANQDIEGREIVNEAEDSDPSEVEDVGLASLDDVLGGPDDDAITVPSGRDGDRGLMGHDRGNKSRYGVTNEKQSCFEGFLKFPAPGVLKTGFDVSRSFRGDEYIHDPATIEQHHSARGHGQSCGPVDFPRYPSRFPPFYNHHQQQHHLPRFRFGHNDVPFKYESSSCFDRTRDSIFDTTENNIEFRKYSNSRDLRVPGFFRYGICYHPSDTDTNFLRTVHISNLPADISTKALLDRVRGGAIISAVLVNTISITGSMTALVQFPDGTSAAAYVEYAGHRSVSFPSSTSSSSSSNGHDDQDKVATITLLSTPTYPFPIIPIITDSEGVEVKQTRCLCISSFPSHISLPELQRDLACNNEYRAASLIHISRREAGLDPDLQHNLDHEHEHEGGAGNNNTQLQPQSSLLNLEFSSVAAAAAAYSFLSSSLVYGEVGVGFEADPCAGDLAELCS